MANTTHESLAAEATSYLRASLGTVDGFNGIQQEIRRQANCLIEWAKKRGVLLNDSFFAGLTKYDKTTREHDVYLRPSDKRVIKCTKPGCFGLAHGSNGKYGNHCAATPFFYLQRLELMNQEFPTDLRLEGISFGVSEFKPDEREKPYMVSSQRYIAAINENRPHPTEKEIERLMTGLGFRILEHSCYNWIRESDGIVVTDTKMPNFISSDAGIVPIDVIIGTAPQQHLSREPLPQLHQPRHAP